MAALQDLLAETGVLLDRSGCKAGGDSIRQVSNSELGRCVGRDVHANLPGALGRAILLQIADVIQD